MLTFLFVWRLRTTGNCDSMKLLIVIEVKYWKNFINSLAFLKIIVMRKIKIKWRRSSKLKYDNLTEYAFNIKSQSVIIISYFLEHIFICYSQFITILYEVFYTYSHLRYYLYCLYFVLKFLYYTQVCVLLFFDSYITRTTCL